MNTKNSKNRTPGRRSITMWNVVIWSLMTLSIWLGSYTLPARAATLLPLAETTFFDNNGNPLSGGTVAFYIPNTLTPKDTWQDAAGSVLNLNPVVLDAGGRALIYGTGSYRQIVKDVNGNTIWDQVTSDTAASTGISWGGTSTGTANAQTVVASGFTTTAGSKLLFIAGASNTGALTVNPNGSGGINVLKSAPTGAIALIGGEVAAGALIELDYDGTQFNLINPVETNLAGPLTALASAATTNLGSVVTHNVDITGTTTITAFGSSATTNYPIFFLKFEGILTLTNNAVSLILPGSVNITTAAGDTALVEYLGAGNWRVRQYTRATGKPVAAGLVNVQVFTSGSGTYTPTASATRGIVIVTGGGGGGGGVATTTGAVGGGGGGGATAMVFVSSLASVSYTVGASGTAGANTGGTGGTGGQSIFGTITANGGAGGVGLTTAPGGGGTGTALGGVGSSTTANATFTVGGTNGQSSFQNNGAGFGIDLAGFGGSSYWGAGPPAPVLLDGSAAGVAPGTGGSGAYRASTNNAGGLGAAGIIVVYEYGY